MEPAAAQAEAGAEAEARADVHPALAGAWAWLPPGVLGVVGSHLLLHERLLAGAACSTWRAALHQGTRVLKHMIDNCTTPEARMYSAAQMAAMLQAAAPHYRHATHAHVLIAGNLKEMRSLGIELSGLGAHTQLTSLVLQQLPYNEFLTPRFKLPPRNARPGRRRGRTAKSYVCEMPMLTHAEVDKLCRDLIGLRSLSLMGVAMHYGFERHLSNAISLTRLELVPLRAPAFSRDAAAMLRWQQWIGRSRRLLRLAPTLTHLTLGGQLLDATDLAELKGLHTLRVLRLADLSPQAHYEDVKPESLTLGPAARSLTQLSSLQLQLLLAPTSNYRESKPALYLQRLLEDLWGLRTPLSIVACPKQMPVPYSEGILDALVALGPCVVAFGLRLEGSREGTRELDRQMPPREQRPDDAGDAGGGWSAALQLTRSRPSSPWARLSALRNVTRLSLLHGYGPSSAHSPALPHDHPTADDLACVAAGMPALHTLCLALRPEAVLLPSALNAAPVVPLPQHHRQQPTPPPHAAGAGGAGGRGALAALRHFRSVRHLQLTLHLAHPWLREPLSMEEVCVLSCILGGWRRVLTQGLLRDSLRSCRKSATVGAAGEAPNEASGGACGAGDGGAASGGAGGAGDGGAASGGACGAGDGGAASGGACGAGDGGAASGGWSSLAAACSAMPAFNDAVMSFLQETAAACKVQEVVLRETGGPMVMGFLEEVFRYPEFADAEPATAAAARSNGSLPVAGGNAVQYATAEDGSVVAVDWASAAPLSQAAATNAAPASDGGVGPAAERERTEGAAPVAHQPGTEASCVGVEQHEAQAAPSAPQGVASAADASRSSAQHGAMAEAGPCTPPTGGASVLRTGGSPAGEDAEQAGCEEGGPLWNVAEAACMELAASVVPQACCSTVPYTPTCPVPPWLRRMLTIPRVSEAEAESCFEYGAWDACDAVRYDGRGLRSLQAASEHARARGGCLLREINISVFGACVDGTYLLESLLLKGPLLDLADMPPRLQRLELCGALGLTCSAYPSSSSATSAAGACGNSELQLLRVCARNRYEEAMVEMSLEELSASGALPPGCRIETRAAPLMDAVMCDGADRASGGADG